MEVFNKEELATYLKVEVKTISSLLYQKKLPKVRIGKEYRFLKDDIDNWLRQSRELPRRFHFEMR